MSECLDVYVCVGGVVPAEEGQVVDHGGSQEALAGNQGGRGRVNQPGGEAARGVEGGVGQPARGQGEAAWCVSAKQHARLVKNGRGAEGQIQPFLTSRAWPSERV